MLYLGLDNGTEALPPQVSNDATITCPVCNGVMSMVASYERKDVFVSRHFRHQEGGQVAKGMITMVVWRLAW
jgi:hypothetical protein